MGDFYQQVVNLITTSPGNLAYHLILTFSIAGALQVALNHSRDSEFPQIRRTVIGLSLMLFVRLVLFFSVGASWQAIAELEELLPVLDRGVTVLSLILIVWLWAFPEPLRLADVAASLLALITLTYMMMSYLWWGDQREIVQFNATWLDVGWQSIAIFVLVLGTLILIYRRPNGWGYGLGMILVALSGHLVQLIYPHLEGDFPEAVRLTQMAVYPLLLALPRRFPIPKMREEESPLIRERQRYSLEPKAFQDLLAIPTQSSYEEVCFLIARSISKAMLADICLVLEPPNEVNEVVFLCGYDLIREEPIDQMSVQVHSIPVLVDAMERGRPLRLPASSTSRDLSSLQNVLELNRSGHLLSVPVLDSGGEVLFGLILFSPHSNRGWNKDDQSILVGAAENLSRIMGRSKQVYALKEELSQAKNLLDEAQDQLQKARESNHILQEELKSSRQRDSQEIEDRGDLEELIEAHRETLKTIAQLRSKNQQLEETIGELTLEGGEELSETSHLEEELRLTLEEVARLKSFLAKADEKLLSLKEGREGESYTIFSDEQMGVITSVVQDFRRPMSSILGYTDILLSESVGILGAMQHKFLERIRVSTERLQGLLDELIQVTAPQSDRMELRPHVVNLVELIDETIEITRDQMLDKNIDVGVDLPAHLPQIHADQDALQQVLIHLLQNACAATPESGAVNLRVELHDLDYDESYVLIQVSDQGEGIPAEDVPRIFSRLYRAETPSIRGVGDSTVGLSIAKTLAEAQGWRIWVDSDSDRGSTFSLLLPMENKREKLDQEEETAT